MEEEEEEEKEEWGWDLKLELLSKVGAHAREIMLEPRVPDSRVSKSREKKIFSSNAHFRPWAEIFIYFSAHFSCRKKNVCDSG